MYGEAAAGSPWEKEELAGPQRGGRTCQQHCQTWERRGCRGLGEQLVTSLRFPLPRKAAGGQVNCISNQLPQLHAEGMDEGRLQGLERTHGVSAAAYQPAPSFTSIPLGTEPPHGAGAWREASGNPSLLTKPPDTCGTALALSMSPTSCPKAPEKKKKTNSHGKVAWKGTCPVCAVWLPNPDIRESPVRLSAYPTHIL